MLTYAERIAWMQAACPHRHGSEVAARHHLFFVRGNGYHWCEGQLAREEEPPVPTPQQMQERYQWADNRAWGRPDPTTLFPLSRSAALLTVPPNVQPELVGCGLGRLGLGVHDHTQPRGCPLAAQGCKAAGPHHHATKGSTMTGIFVRIKRAGPDGPSRPVDLDEMTDAELDSLDEAMAQREAWMTWTWVKGLARYIRDQRLERGRAPQQNA